MEGKALPKPQSNGSSDDTDRLLHLSVAYRMNGHRLANLDPLGIQKPSDNIADLDPLAYGFTKEDMNRPLVVSEYAGQELSGLLSQADLLGNSDGVATLSEVVQLLKTVYCGNTGVEYMHIADMHKRNWLQERLERPLTPLSKEKRVSIYRRLAYADRFENFLATKFNTAKRFGMEGLESTCPGLKAIIDKSTEMGCENVVVGMPHRGRLSILANVIRKPMELIFKEFAGTNVPDPDDWSGSGDVKYHLGTNFTRTYPDGREVNLSLLANPSHLEAVDALVAGKCRAKMHYMQDTKGDKVLPLLLHGDAAFAGQGIVYETMQMSQLKGYQCGGTIHVITNNQIGFTTTPGEDRSTPYASDIGKGFQCPIFHVNADDPEEVHRVCEIAAEYRMTFHTDVIVDIIGYRRYGHNELDQPMFTQPEMYKVIKNHPSTLDIYSKKILEGPNAPSQEEIVGIHDYISNQIKERYDASIDYKSEESWQSTAWDNPKDSTNKLIGSGVALSHWGNPQTGVSLAELKEVSSALTNIPEGFTLHPQIKRILKAKQDSLDAGTGLDWGTAEALAFGTLLKQGVHVRLSGQDAERGTFSHRHAVLHDQNSDKLLTPLANVPGAQEAFNVHNSHLSEYAVLGYELGYSMQSPNQLVIWEAQFGDFANGAQIIIDQFITAGEAKWLRQTGLTLLLPHGYDGQGPEHSSCRIERWLQCSDEDPDQVPEGSPEDAIRECNWQICNITTPANYFHALRRQLHRDFRKPLIVASPKALLRLRACSSSLEDMTEGESFRRLISETEPEKLVAPEKMRRVVFCSGKIYYEVLAARQAAGVDDVALVRVEQISPFPFDKVAWTMEKYSNAEIVWLQEEPKNMGAWSYVQDRIMTATRVLNKQEQRPAYIGRKTMASPAEGYGSMHTKEQNELLQLALSHDVRSYGHGITK